MVEIPHAGIDEGDAGLALLPRRQPRRIAAARAQALIGRVKAVRLDRGLILQLLHEMVPPGEPRLEAPHRASPACPRAIRGRPCAPRPPARPRAARACPRPDAPKGGNRRSRPPAARTSRGDRSAHGCPENDASSASASGRPPRWRPGQGSKARRRSRASGIAPGSIAKPSIAAGTPSRGCRIARSRRAAQPSRPCSRRTTPGCGTLGPGETLGARQGPDRAVAGITPGVAGFPPHSRSRGCRIARRASPERPQPRPPARQGAAPMTARSARRAARHSAMKTVLPRRGVRLRPCPRLHDEQRQHRAAPRRRQMQRGICHGP